MGQLCRKGTENFGLECPFEGKLGQIVQSIHSYCPLIGHDVIFTYEMLADMIMRWSSLGGQTFCKTLAKLIGYPGISGSIDSVETQLKTRRQEPSEDWISTIGERSHAISAESAMKT